MHLGNGAITPECGVVALGVAAAGAAAAYWTARAAGVERGKARTAGALGAAVFGAQLFNVQILPFSSAHLIGGVLLAWVIGPALGMLAMAGILTIQALVLGDGGMLSLGANIFNMGMIPAAGVAMLRRYAPASSPARTAALLGFTAFACTLAGAGAIVLEVAAGRSAAELAGWQKFAGMMLWTHALAGLLEAAATVAIAELVFRGRVDVWRLSPVRAATVITGSLAVALLSLPSLGLASLQPDGYQFALATVSDAGHALGSIEVGDRLSGLSGALQSWQTAIVCAFAGPEALLLMLTTFVAGLTAWAFASSFVPHTARTTA